MITHGRGPRLRPWTPTRSTARLSHGASTTRGRYGVHRDDDARHGIAGGTPRPTARRRSAPRSGPIAGPTSWCGRAA
jgi:hypothetical protein